MNLIFDFDGTICDSTKAALDIMNLFLKNNNLQGIKSSELRNSGLKGVIKTKNIPLLKISKLVSYGTKQLSEYIPNLKTFPGMKTTLKNLSNENYLAIITSNSLPNVKKFLTKNDLDSLFKEIDTDFSLFGKDKKIKNLIKRNKLKPEDTYYIGDETRDIEAAKKAKVKSVAVTWGYESKNSLLKSTPDIIFSRPVQLLNLK